VPFVPIFLCQKITKLNVTRKKLLNLLFFDDMSQIHQNKWRKEHVSKSKLDLQIFLQTSVQTVCCKYYAIVALTLFLSILQISASFLICL